MKSYSKNIIKPFKINYSQLIDDLKKFSFTRSIQHQIISQLNLSGKTIDIGGGETSSYRNFLNQCDYESLNINNIREPTYIVNPDTKTYPINSNTYDYCLCLNLLEHVYDWSIILSESFRILKQDGKILVMVPFFYPIHPDPDDYIRPTSSFLRNALHKYGFCCINIQPVSLGPLSTALFCLPRLSSIITLKYASVFLDLMYFKIFSRGNNNYKNIFPTFYFVTADKTSSVANIS